MILKYLKKFWLISIKRRNGFPSSNIAERDWEKSTQGGGKGGEKGGTYLRRGTTGSSSSCLSQAFKCLDGMGVYMIRYIKGTTDSLILARIQMVGNIHEKGF